jgi:hypothetical protein
MKKTLLCLALFIVLVPAYAVELSYKWKAGTSYRFKMNAKDDISLNMSMMGMSQTSKETYLTETTLRLEVVSVDADGTAKGFLYVESFNVKTDKGVKVAGIAAIPAKALKADISVDKKGNFTFYKRVFVIVQDNTALLGSAKISEDGTSASATASNGEEQVTVYAEFNPKTGAYKAGYSVKSVSAPVVKTIETKAEDSEIDIIPYQVLDLLALPEGNTQQGDETTVESGYYTIGVKTVLANATTAKIENTISTDKNKSVGTQKVNSNSDQGNMDMNSMGNMGGDMDAQMNTTMEGSNSSPKDMMPKTDGKFAFSFNVTKGMFDKVEGNINLSQDMMGVNIKSATTLKLMLIP